MIEQTWHEDVLALINVHERIGCIMRDALLVIREGVEDADPRAVAEDALRSVVAIVGEAS